MATPGYLTDGANWATADSNKLATIGLIKAGIKDAIDNINVTLSFDNTTGKISVGSNEGVQLANVAHDPVYDATNLKITIPVYGKDDVVINIPKDKFVTAGVYNTVTKNIELTIQGQDEKVLIPASDLVDVYTANNTDKNITVTITDNTISASLTIDPIATNALTYSDKGFLVDTTSKLDKLTDSVGGKIVISKADGTVQESTIAINTTEDLGTSTVTIPTENVITNAITTAINTAGKGKIDTVIGKENNIVIFGTDGAIKDSGVKIGGAIISDTPDELTLATEAAVTDALSWKELG